MSNNSVIVDKYAKAAFALAKKAKLTEVFVKDFSVFCQNISGFLKEITNPTIAKSEIENIIGDLSKKLNLNPLLQNFLITLAEARRLNLASKIQQKLENMVKKDNQVLQVELISAKQLKEEQLTQIQELLKTKYPQNKIEINEVIKKDILGGIIIKIGSFVIDSSVKNQLSTIYAEANSAINY